MSAAPSRTARIANRVGASCVNSKASACATMKPMRTDARNSPSLPRHFLFVRRMFFSNKLFEGHSRSGSDSPAFSRFNLDDRRQPFSAPATPLSTIQPPEAMRRKTRDRRIARILRITMPSGPQSELLVDAAQLSPDPTKPPIFNKLPKIKPPPVTDTWERQERFRKRNQIAMNRTIDPFAAAVACPRQKAQGRESRETEWNRGGCGREQIRARMDRIGSRVRIEPRRSDWPCAFESASQSEGDGTGNEWERSASARVHLRSNRVRSRDPSRTDQRTERVQ